MRFAVPLDAAGAIPVEAGVSQYEAADEANPVMVAGKTTQRFSGIFDTGASGTVISQRVASALGLKKIYKVTVQTANGEAEQDVHVVNVVLGNGVVFSGMMVTAAPLCGIDLLIGMDILRCGDFTISNRHGFLTVSFDLYSLVEPPPS